MGRHEKILKRGEDIAVLPDSHQPHEGHWPSVFPNESQHPITPKLLIASGDEDSSVTSSISSRMNPSEGSSEVVTQEEQKSLSLKDAGGAQERRDGTLLGLLKIDSGGWSDPLREETKRDEEVSGAS